MSGDNLAQTCNVVIGEQVAGWKTFRSQRSAFNRDTTTALRRLSYCWEIICATVSHEGQRGSFTSLSKITHYLCFWTGPAARSCTWVCTISLLAKQSDRSKSRSESSWLVVHGTRDGMAVGECPQEHTRLQRNIYTAYCVSEWVREMTTLGSTSVISCCSPHFQWLYAKCEPFIFPEGDARLCCGSSTFDESEKINNNSNTFNTFPHVLQTVTWATFLL